MSRQDAIAEVILSTRWTKKNYASFTDYAADVAEAIDTRLRDARTITTVAELDALPVGTVIQVVRPNRWRPDIPDVWQRWDGDRDITDWCPIGDVRWGSTFESHDLPATVLYRPEDTP